MPLYQHVMVGRRLLRPVRRLRRRRVGRVREGGRAGQPRADPGRPRRLGQQPADARPPLAAQGQAGLVEEPAQRRQRPPGLDPEPGRRRRPARPRGLLPAIVFIFSRVGCDAAVTAVPERQPAPDHARGARRDLRVRRGALLGTCPTRTCTCSATTTSSTALTRGVAAHHAGHAADVQGVRRGAVPARAVQGRLRDRDARARHQHARPLGGDREAVQVERRDPRRHHAGGVHPAHRPGRPSRHRRRGPRRGALAAGHEPAASWPASPRPAPTRSGRRSGRRTTWRSTWCTSSAASARASCWSSRSRSSRPTRPSSGWPGSCARARRRSTGYARGGDLPPRRLHGVRRAAPPDLRPREGGRAGRAGPTGARRCSTRWSGCKPGDVIEVPAGKFAGFAVVDRPGRRPARRAAALRAHRRPAGPAAGAGRLPDAGGGR